MKKKMITKIMGALLVCGLMLTACGPEAIDKRVEEEETTTYSVIIKSGEEDSKENKEVNLTEALLKYMLGEKDGLSKDELMREMEKYVAGKEAASVMKDMEIRFDIQALKAAMKMKEENPQTNNSFVEKKLQERKFSSEEITFALENYMKAEAADIIKEETAKYVLTAEERAAVPVVETNQEDSSNKNEGKEESRENQKSEESSAVVEEESSEKSESSEPSESGSQEQAETEESAAAESSSETSESSAASAETHVCNHVWEDITTVVHHDAEYTYEEIDPVYSAVWVEDTPAVVEKTLIKEAWDEEVPVYEQKTYCKCLCGALFETMEELDEHFSYYLSLADGSQEQVDYFMTPHDGNAVVILSVQVGTETVHHEAEYEEKVIEKAKGHFELTMVEEGKTIATMTKEAWDEVVVTGQRCTICGETR